ncbi:MAG: radical SAM protein [Myxococcales bacterium]|nr:radical SAM protein [Myxococcales bacterium]
MVQILSIELGTRCDKACDFCYSHSSPEGADGYAPADVIALVRDCVAHGLKAVSFGGGEPLQYPGLFEILHALQGQLFRSFTTNGLLLDAALQRVVQAAPDKVHVSVHFPDREREVVRVAEQVQRLADHGVPSGVNLLVDRRQLDAAQRACATLQAQGIGLDRMVLLPMRGAHTPTPTELAQVAGTSRFQSMTCLLSCAKSPRFASLAADGTAAWCSYTTTRRALPTLDHAGLMAALDGLGLAFCGPTPLPGTPLDP